MCNRKKNIWLLLLFLPCTGLWAQMPPAHSDSAGDSTAPKRGHWELYASAGITAYTQGKQLEPAFPVQSQHFQNPGMRLGLHWQSAFLLGISVEASAVRWYKYQVRTDSSTATLSANAFPFLLLFSLALPKNFNLHAGPGYVLEVSHLQDQGSVRGIGGTIAWTAGLGYRWSLDSRWDLEGEIHFLDAYRAGDAMVGAWIGVIYRPGRPYRSH